MAMILSSLKLLQRKIRDHNNNMSDTTTTTTNNDIPINEMTYEQYHGSQGSWIPTLLIFTILLIRYFLSKSIKFQRFVSTQKITLRKRLGYRDETKYEMGVGDGANMKLKRQG